MTIFHVTAQPATIHDQVLVFTWDSDTGEVSGPDAEQVLEWARTLRGQYVERKPYGLCWLLADPLRNPVDMAVLIGRRHILPSDLQAFYPEWSPPGRVSPGVELLY